MLEGFQLAQKENENIRLLIIGDGELLPKLERFTGAQSLTKFVQFLGRIKTRIGMESYCGYGYLCKSKTLMVWISNKNI